LNLIKRVIGELGKESETLSKCPVWRNVAPVKIFEILNEYHFYKGSFRSDLVREYIQKQNEKGELTSWSIVLINIPSGTEFTIGEYKIGMSTRNPDPNNKDIYAIKKGQIIDKKHEFIDFSDEQKQRALQKMLIDPDRKQKGEKIPDMPSGPYIRGERSPINGLLLIYILDPAPKGVDIDVPVTGLAFSFPESRTASRVIYTVNNQYWEDEFASQ
jgi:hypothetical protein